MERPAWAPPGIDISVPSVSRIYDYYLGGSHNFEVDRQAARRAMEFMPGLPKIMQANRAFMRRAVRYAVGQGVTQFLDIGSGIPTFGNVHEIARAASPEARVVYVDHDPVAVAHSRAVLAGDDHADIVAADLRKPREILAAPEVGRLLDLGRPVALLLVAVLHFLEGADDPYAAVAGLRDALAPGSLLVLTHASYEGIPLTEEVAAGTVGVYRDIRNPLVMRSGAEITRFFDGFELVEPGVVAMPNWRPDGAAGSAAGGPVDSEAAEDPYAFSGFGGVGRKA
ncbi:SAM-dependent methyltransferase [Streptomyces goshikiensis]|uniref:SAM-dependent methyltransferase n=1 Tax=Streptomyces goshikiensis TaxID=1942 RepID=UPI00366511FF